MEVLRSCPGVVRNVSTVGKGFTDFNNEPILLLIPSANVIILRGYELITNSGLGRYRYPVDAQKKTSGVYLRSLLSTGLRVQTPTGGGGAKFELRIHTSPWMIYSFSLLYFSANFCHIFKPNKRESAIVLRSPIDTLFFSKFATGIWEHVPDIDRLRGFLPSYVSAVRMHTHYATNQRKCG